MNVTSIIFELCTLGHYSTVFSPVISDCTQHSKLFFSRRTPIPWYKCKKKGVNYENNGVTSMK